MRFEDNDIAFIGEVIDETKSFIYKMRNLSVRYDVHPYTSSHGLIKSSSLLSAAAATTIYNFTDEFKTKIEVAEKVNELFKTELYEMINEVEFNEKNLIEEMIH